MKKIVVFTIALLIAFVSMNFQCEDHISGQNGPFPKPIDTTNVKHLDTTMQVSINVKVYEWDRSTSKSQISSGVSVYFTNIASTIITDSTGYARTTFSVDSIPYKYGFIASKDGYESCGINNWETHSEIVSSMIIYKDTIN